MKDFSSTQSNLKNHTKVKNQLWRYRTQMGYSQMDLARLMGHKSTARICDYERGKRLPSVKIALQLSILLRTPIPQLYPELYTQLKSELSPHKNAPLRA